MIQFNADYFQELGYTQHHGDPLSIPLPQIGRGGVVLDPMRPDSARLHWHNDERGSLIELYRQSWEVERDRLETDQYGLIRQAYISTTRPGVVKGWHLHMMQTDRFVCLRGKIMLALCPLITPYKKVECVTLDAQRGPGLYTVPPGVAHGWKSIGQEEAWVLNLCSHEYDGTDEWRRPAHSGPSNNLTFNWNKEVDG